MSFRLKKIIPFGFMFLMILFTACDIDSGGNVFSLSSSADGGEGFDPGSEIPVNFRSSIGGDNDFPRLVWENPPEGTESQEHRHSEPEFPWRVAARDHVSHPAFPVHLWLI